MFVRIVLGDNLPETLEICFRLRLEVVPLVGQRPPYIPIGPKPGNHVPQVTIIVFRAHVIEAPVPGVVRMEQNHIRLDPHLGELSNPVLEMLKEIGIDTSEIPMVRCLSSEGVSWRLGMVIVEPLGEKAHSEL